MLSVVERAPAIRSAVATIMLWVAAISCEGSNAAPARGPVAASATPTAEVSAAVASCSGSKIDCDGVDRNGCEVDVSGDSKNCGRCGHSCLGGACSSGTCEPVTMAKACVDGDRIAVRDGAVYFVRCEPGTIVRATAPGGELQELGPSEVLAGKGIAADRTDLFLIDWDTAKGRLLRASIADGNVTSLASDLREPSFLALDDSTVYWIDRGDGRSRGKILGTVYKVAKQGGTRIALASDQENATSLVIDEKNLYWQASNEVVRLPKAGGSRTVVFSPPSVFNAESLEGGILHIPWALAVDEAYLYWIVATTDGLLARMPKEGREVTILAKGQGAPQSLAVDDESVYWTTSNAIWAVPKSGGSPRVVARGLSHPAFVTLDAVAIYWVSKFEVMRLAK